VIRDGSQIEQPDNWLRCPDPWEIARPGRVYTPCRCNAKFELRGSNSVNFTPQPPASSLLGMAYDRPVVGYGANCINTLRLWAAAAPQSFDFAEFSHGDFAGAVIDNVAAESVTRVLYPGRLDRGRPRAALPAAVLHGQLLAAGHHRAVHPTRTRQRTGRRCRIGRGADERYAPGAVRGGVDAHSARSGKSALGSGLGHHAASLAYTNHTLLPEALEKWPVDLFETLIPRQLEIIYEINQRFLDDVRRRYPGDEARVQRVSLIEEGPGSPRAHGASGRGRLAQHQRRGRRFIRICCARTCCVTSPNCTRSASTTRPTA
jgi:starch phosphorylase